MSVEGPRPVLRRGMVKICGLREPEHAAAAAAAGADLLGFNFAPTRRQVSAETARVCIEAAREAADRPILATGIFVDASEEEIETAAKAAGLDLVQLHGGETPAFVEALSLPVTKVLRPRDGASPADVLAEIESFRAARRSPVGFLLDTYAVDTAGGTGVKGDWDLAAEVSAVHPIVLAGGLDPHNVGIAVSQVRPLGVDVASGVEIGGIKDAGLIEDFIREAKAAFLAAANQNRRRQGLRPA